MDKKELQNLIDRISLTGPEGIKKIKKVLKEMSQSDNREGDGGGSGGTSDYKTVKLLSSTIYGYFEYFESLADIIDTVCSERYIGGVVVGDIHELDGTSGVRYMSITACEYAQLDNGEFGVFIQDSDGDSWAIFDSPDLLRWLAGVEDGITMQTGMPFCPYQGKYVNVTMQGDLGAALQIGIEEERGGSKGVMVCDSNGYPYVLAVSDGVITGISLFDQSMPEGSDTIRLGMDKVSPIVGCKVSISENETSDGGGTIIVDDGDPSGGIK